MAKEQEKIHITIIHPCMINGKPVQSGKSYHAHKQEAQDLFNAGKAKPVEKLTAEDKAIIDENHQKLKTGLNVSDKKTADDVKKESNESTVLTKDEIKKELERLKISYGSRESLEELQEKLNKALSAHTS